jgi:glucose-6-phosphate 1-dehydrogenase
VCGYREEEGVAPASTAETFVAFRAFVDTWRWSGVPFYLRTGKRLPVRVTEIGVHFRPVPPVLFNADAARPLEANVLSIRIQPDEGVSMRFQVKVPGPAVRIEPFQMEFGYAGAFAREPPEAYERLLVDAALGDATLFARSDEVEAAWAFVGPILEGCSGRPVARLPEYAAGSWGPAEADALIQADGRRWMLLKPSRPAARPDAKKGTP